MSFELVYTSAQRGLKPNSSGFCTVAATGGISKLVSMKLEGLSAYEFHFKLSDANANLNPANFAHTVVKVGGKRQSVLSRVGFAGPDYSGRANKIAHHFLLGDQERLDAGPGEMLAQLADGEFRQQWQGEPSDLQPRSLAESLNNTQPSGPAGHWQSVAGDAGWAGMLAKAFKEGGRVPAYVIYAPGTDALKLFAESLAVLPPQQRWEVNFATYYTSMPAGCYYNWRGILAGSRAAHEIAKFPNAMVIDLTKPLGQAPDNEYTNAARSGQALAAAASTAAGVSAGLRNVEPDDDEIDDLDDIYQLAQEEEPTRPAKRRRKVAAPIEMLAAGAPPTQVTSAARGNRGLKITIAVLSLLVVVLLITFVLTLSFFKGTRPPSIAGGGSEGGANIGVPSSPATKPKPPATTKSKPPATTKPKPPATKPKPPATTKPKPPATTKPKPPATTKPKPPATTKPKPPTTAKHKPKPSTYAKLSILRDEDGRALSSKKPGPIIRCSKHKQEKGYFEFKLSGSIQGIWLRSSRMSGDKKPRLEPNLPKKGTFVRLEIPKSGTKGLIQNDSRNIAIAEYRALANRTGLEVRILPGKHQNLAKAVVVDVKVDKKFYRCRILQEEKTEILHVGFTDDGKVLGMAYRRIEIKYHWPKKLLLKLPDGKPDGKTVGFESGAGVLKRGYKPLLRLNWTKPKHLESKWFVPPRLGWEIQDGGKGTTAGLELWAESTGDILKSIKRVAAAIVKKEGKAQKDLGKNREVAGRYAREIQNAKDAKRKPHPRYNRDLNKLNNEHPSLKRVLGNAKREIDKLVLTINALQNKRNELPEIVVLDPWGVPLKRFKVEFSVGKKGQKIDRAFIELLAKTIPRK